MENNSEFGVLEHIRKFEKSLEDIDVKLYNLEWKTYFGEDPPGLRDLRENRIRTYNDLDNFKKIKLLKEKILHKNTQTSPVTNILSRWDEELSKDILSTEELRKMSLNLIEFEDELKKIRGSFRVPVPTSKDKTKTIPLEETQNILRSEKDRTAREETWRKRATLGDILLKKGFKKLIKNRNDFAKIQARELGYRNPDSYNFYSLRFKQMDFNEDEIFQIFQELKTKSDNLTFKIISRSKQELGLQNVEPWDITFITYRDILDLDSCFKVEELNENTLKTVEGLGFTPSDYNLTFDLYPKDGKFDNAMCFTINPPIFIGGSYKSRGDVKLFANLIKGGLREQKTIFHEWGHLVHSAETKQEFYLFRALPNNPSLTEGIAGLFEYFATEKEFFKDVLAKRSSNLNLDKIQKALESYKVQEAETALLELRLILSRVYFEREIYKNPDSDYAQVWSKTLKEFLFAKRQDDVNAWIERPHFISHPVYYQSYAVAALLKEQFYSFLKRNFRTIINNKKVGDHLKERCFSFGNSRKWEDIAKSMIGEGLSPEPFLQKTSCI